MYHPYLRGKQFELMVIRETAPLMADERFIPIIEPVKRNLTGLERALSAVESAGGSVFITVNPQYGDFYHDPDELDRFVHDRALNMDNIRPALILDHNTSLEEAERFTRRFEGREIGLIHAGFREGRVLGPGLAGQEANLTHIFHNRTSDALYRRHFRHGVRVALEDGFVRQKNSAYAPVDSFSSLHVTFGESYSGFGDFLTVGDEYSEGGGPAYAVAIHLTYVDPSDDDRMYVYHFKSDDNDTPVDPGRKFRQALAKLAAAVQSSDSCIYSTEALGEFLELHRQNHFPGLGYVKKLSMKHHIETMAMYLARN